MDIKLKLLEELGLAKERRLKKAEVEEYLKSINNEKYENIKNDPMNEEYYEIYNDFDNEELKTLSWLKITKSIIYIGKFFRLMYILTIIGIVIYLVAGIVALIMITTS